MKNNQTILIIEDNPANMALLTGYLKLWGFDFMVADNGESGLRKAGKGGDPDLILLDVFMPVMDGFEVCRQLKSNPSTAEIPVIFLTADNDEADKVRGFEMGAVDYITKPFHPQEVLARINRHLELRTLQKQALIIVSAKSKKIIAYKEVALLYKTAMKKRTRAQIAEDLLVFEAGLANNPDASQRDIIEGLGISRSTLQHWLNRKDTIDAAPEVVNFFESPVGTAYLHRLVSGLHFVFTLCNPCGIRAVCEYLELTGLDKFVASSYGSQQKVSKSMEEGACEFGKEEKQCLAEGMTPKKISAIEDETFHPETCLVAIEPVSNYILLEEYASGRKADDWTSALEKATEGLNVEVIQVTSDEGKGIVSHVKNDLKAHHSPDLFHIQHELIKGTSVMLKSRVKKAEKALKEASEEVSRQQEAKVLFNESKRQPGR
ncbi:MAG: response regulator, partial [Desulfamplus sp.]|nr:response regulator [Desulfamplus sp.]